MKGLANLICFIEPLRAQYAIKLTLAGLVTYYLANWLRLDEPAWGVATCVVLAMAKHVGAIGEKAMLRTLGNLVGGFLGILLIGNFAENGLALMGGFFVITAYCSWRYGGNAHPYAYLLAALTLNRVVVPNYNTPGDAWDTAMNRVLEITLGIAVSTIVFSVLWPRYARVEFLNELRASFRELAESLRGQANEPAYFRIIQQSNARLTKLRQLLSSGARESAYFRHHFAVYSDLANKINSLYVFAGTAIREKESHLTVDAATECVHRLQEIAAQRIEAIDSGETERSLNLRAEFRKVLEKLRQLLLPRMSPPDAEARHFAGLYLTLKQLHSQIRQVGELYRFLQSDPSRALRYPFSPGSRAPNLPTDSFWIRNAIKSTTAGCLAWLLCNWLQPPGATFIPYLVWYFTLMSRQFQENFGDRGVFQFAFLNTLLGLPYLAFAFLVTPLLPSYAVMNVTLGTMLLLYGYFTATYAGWSRFSRMAFFMILSWLGLNAQSPVGTQAILDSYLQVIIGLWFAALVDRLWWPILPQWEVCSRLAHFFGKGASYLRHPTSPERLRWLQQMGLHANEAASWARQLKAPEFADGEPERWNQLLDTLRLSTYRLRLLVFLARRNQGILREAHGPITVFHVELRHYYEQWQHVFEKRGLAPKPNLAALDEARQTLAQLDPHTLPATHRLLFEGLAASADNLLTALHRFDEQIASIPLADYSMDQRL